jgi:ribonucleases P/MRP protein subunit RPP40
VLESIIRDNIIEHLIQNNLVSNKQYGFFKGRSTVTQLIKILDKWTDYLENGGQVDVIYTDLEKAFDKVSHAHLINKLKYYKFNHQLLEWINSFLTKRSQRVRINESFSHWVKVLSGIPQGSVLGPLLFLLYINDLASLDNFSSELFLFADDAKLFRYISKQSDTMDLQKDLNVMYEWLSDSLLMLNVSKCKVVSYGRNVLFDSQYTIGNENVEKVNIIKDLGVTFDKSLKFKEHILEKINKAYSVIGLIKRNFIYISEISFCMLYKAMVRSHLEYAVSVWCPYRKEDILRVEKVQMRATKLVVSVKNLPYKERLQKLKLPTLKYRRLRGDMIEVYKIINLKYDVNTTVALETCKDSKTRGNRHKLNLNHCHYDLRKHFFTNRVVAIWNSLPDNVVDVNSINIFKNRLDSYWCMQDVVFDFESDLTGIGNRSF